MLRDYITVPVLCSDVQHVGFAVISFFTSIREVQILGKTVVRSCETGTHQMWILQTAKHGNKGFLISMRHLNASFS